MSKVRRVPNRLSLARKAWWDKMSEAERKAFVERRQKAKRQAQDQRDLNALIAESEKRFV